MTTPPPRSVSHLRPGQPGAAQRTRPANQPRQNSNRTNNVNIKLPDLGSLPPLSFSMNKTVVNGAPATSGTNGSSGGVPGSDFTSNEDIHAYANHGRREARDRATRTAMDAEALLAILRHIPDSTGSHAGARIRAMKVARYLKKVATAEKIIAKLYVSLYACFQREYEAELNKIGKGRPQQAPKTPFSWR